MASSYNGFVPQSCAIKGTKAMIVKNGSTYVGKIGLHTLDLPQMGNKLYSFGALADIHYQYSTASTDFQKALTYLSTYGANFTCICGDLSANGTDAELAEYKACVDTYSAGVPVYAISGNHEGWTANVEQRIATYTGHPMYYSITQGNDVFIMLGVKSSTEGSLFTTAELQWLYETLEANRNKRCFVFEHVRPQDGCGNAYGIYNYDIWGGTEQIVFESLMQHYHNVILFHGHSHLKFNLQTLTNCANIDRLFGCWSVHIPSLAVPRTGDPSGASSRREIYADSEGYIVDVYANHIRLCGRDFVADEWIPQGSFCLNTTLQIIEPNTYIDTTGTIVT